MTLESSESEFTSRYAGWAASGLLYPQREGSPLLEFAAGGRVLYLFDRCGPYAAPPGPAQIIVHGLLDMGATRLSESTATPQEQLTVLGVSGLEGTGRVVEVTRRAWIVQARLPLVLSVLGPRPSFQVGDWLSFRTVPPLHGFVVTTGSQT